MSAWKYWNMRMTSPPPPQSEDCQNPWALSSSGTQYQSGCAFHRPKLSCTFQTRFPSVPPYMSLSTSSHLFVFKQFWSELFLQPCSPGKQHSRSSVAKERQKSSGRAELLYMYNIALSVFLKCFRWIGEMVQWLRA